MGGVLLIYQISKQFIQFVLSKSNLNKKAASDCVHSSKVIKKPFLYTVGGATMSFASSAYYLTLIQRQ